MSESVWLRREGETTQEYIQRMRSVTVRVPAEKSTAISYTVRSTLGDAVKQWASEYREDMQRIKDANREASESDVSDFVPVDYDSVRETSDYQREAALDRCIQPLNDTAWPSVRNAINDEVARLASKLPSMATERVQGTGFEEYGTDSLDKSLTELYQDLHEELADAYYYMSLILVREREMKQRAQQAQARTSKPVL